MKVLYIALKDTLIRFRDRNALLLMLAAPLVISVIMGAAFGTGGSVTLISDIPFVIVNADDGEFGQDVVDIFKQDELADLFAVQEMDDLSAAQRKVEMDELRGVLYIPPQFSERIASGGDADAVSLELYLDPTANISPSILRAVTAQIASGYSTAVIGSKVVVEAISAEATTLGPKAANLAPVLQEELEAFGASGDAFDRIEMDTYTVGQSEEINLMGFFVPSMAIFFLMFAMFDGTRSILEEEDNWTMQRLMTTPTSNVAILAGKLVGALLTGILQFTILVVVSTVFFNIEWGDPAALVLLMLGTTVAAVSLGALITAFARNTNQAGILGTGVNLVFAILGGNFVQGAELPVWLDAISRLTLNKWALDGFMSLTLGSSTLPDLMPNILMLFGMGIVFFVLALSRFRTRFVR